MDGSVEKGRWDLPDVRPYSPTPIDQTVGRNSSYYQSAMKPGGAARTSYGGGFQTEYKPSKARYLASLER